MVAERSTFVRVSKDGISQALTIHVKYENRLLHQKTRYKVILNVCLQSGFINNSFSHLNDEATSTSHYFGEYKIQLYLVYKQSKNYLCTKYNMDKIKLNRIAID